VNGTVVWSISRMVLIGNWSTGSETCPNTVWSTSNPTWTSLVLNPTLCSERLPPTSLVVVDPVTTVKLWGYALHSLRSKSLYWQTLCTDIHISENLCDRSYLIYIKCRKYLSFFLNLLLFVNLQGCAVKMGLCQGEDH